MRLLIVILTTAIWTFPCLGQSGFIHSDVPLWGYDEESVWPKNFQEDDSFGCAHNIRLGDWKLTDEEGEDGWFRFSNYGYIHCFIVVTKGDELASLESAKSELGFLVGLGKVKLNTSNYDLWALQLGSRPGSDYILFRSLAFEGAEKPITAFEFLPIECPNGHLREGPSLDILPTRYCAINSKQDLVSLAKKMAILKPAGELKFVDETLASK
ncbi:MAG: hypothetical protein JJ850_00365 [Kordiimonadaceae bacterium]|nr:hypothetical protein [Kordiimonadaceae bacterium]MBO6567748.1 hypothetical protein [Kordiimonadaceae bacterium]MBO6963037.1 hypothetical protein [Kordiimonadaceae bacterium]